VGLVWYVLCLLRCAMCLVFYVVCLLWFFKWPCHWQFYSPYIHLQYTNILIVKVYGPVLARREGRRCVLNGLVTGSSPRSLFPRRNPWRACERLCLSVPSLSLPPPTLPCSHAATLLIAGSYVLPLSLSPSLPLSLSPSLPLSLSPLLRANNTEETTKALLFAFSPTHCKSGGGRGEGRQGGRHHIFLSSPLACVHVGVWVCVCCMYIFSLGAISQKNSLC
jgi:hypothetical protein